METAHVITNHTGASHYKCNINIEVVDYPCEMYTEKPKVYNDEFKEHGECSLRCLLCTTFLQLRLSYNEMEIKIIMKTNMNKYQLRLKLDQWNGNINDDRNNINLQMTKKMIELEYCNSFDFQFLEVINSIAA